MTNCEYIDGIADVGVCTYVDDIFESEAESSDRTANALGNLLIGSNDCLEDFLRKGGHPQNLGKEEVAPAICSTKQNLQFYKCDGVGRVLLARRHFGAFYQPGSAAYIECNLEIKAMKAGWCAMIGF